MVDKLQWFLVNCDSDILRGLHPDEALHRDPIGAQNAPKPSPIYGAPRTSTIYNLKLSSINLFSGSVSVNYYKDGILIVNIEFVW